MKYDHLHQFNFNDSLGFLLNRTALVMKRELQTVFKDNDFDLTAEHWAVLNCVWEEPGINQTEIAKRITKEKTNLTRILDVMEKRELISRRRDEYDRRSFCIFPTQTSMEKRTRLSELAHSLNSKALFSLNDRDTKELKRILNVIYTNLYQED